MSDKSSESSGDSWVFVNENDDMCFLDEETQSSNSEINNDSVCLAASNSIKSSLSSEELELQYEHLEKDIDILPCCSSHVEELNLDDSGHEHAKSHDLGQTEDTELSNLSLSDYEEKADIDIASVHKMHSYKHNRNDRLNFILNVMLALTVSSALGFGTGHFLGWSHKCWRNMPYFKDDASNHIVPDTPLINENMEDFLTAEKEIKSSHAFSQNTKEAFDLSTKMKISYISHETCNKALENGVINGITNKIFQNSVSSNSNVLELSLRNVVNQNNFSNSEHLIATKTIHNWSNVSQVTLPVKSLNEQLSHNDETVLERDKDLASKEIYLQSNFFTQYDNIIKDSNKDTNFTSELHKDLIRVVQILNTIALAHISSGKDMSVEDLGLMTKLFKDLEVIINTKISYIDEFMQCEDYKRYPKFGLKHTQKMAYSLIDTFDHVMKINMKTFRKEHRQVNSFKFSKSISKIISTFERRWEKYLKSWSQNIENAKAREQKLVYNYSRNTLKREKKYWKRSIPFDNDSNKINKYKKHSVKY